MKISLNKKELELIIDHLGRDMSYGGGGTFGEASSLDGDLDLKEYKQGQKVLSKLINIYKQEVKK